MTHDNVLKIAKRFTLYVAVREYRRTFEEANICVSPFEVIRGFGAVSLLAEDKTLQQLQKFLKFALFGPDVKNHLDGVHQTIFRLSRSFVHPTTSAAVRVFFEKRSVLPLKDEILVALERFHREPPIPEAPSLKSDEKVFREINFNQSPTGYESRININKVMKIATNGRIDQVVRRDQSPDWRTRLAVASCLDGNFYWKASGAEDPRKTYFVDSPDRVPAKRSVVTAVKVQCVTRSVVWKSKVRVVQLQSFDEDMKLYVVHPLQMALSETELLSLDGETLRQYIEACAREAEVTTTVFRIQKALARLYFQVMMPLVSMACPSGVLPAFQAPATNCIAKLFCKDKNMNRKTPFLNRIFDPYKSEFHKIVNEEHGFGNTYRFPLYDHFHKTKFNILLFERPPIDVKAVFDLVHRPLAPLNPNAPKSEESDEINPKTVKTQEESGEEESRAAGGADNNNEKQQPPSESLVSINPTPSETSSTAVQAASLVSTTAPSTKRPHVPTRTYITYKERKQGRRMCTYRYPRDDRSITLKYEADEVNQTECHLSTVWHGVPGQHQPMDAEINLDSSFLFVGVVAHRTEGKQFPLYMGRFTNINEICVEKKISTGANKKHGDCAA
ncbi:hypothetical protein L596_010835 [Steinernema carpocapsae]|uniref:Serpin domain-containing protein n=1 Tax=Steinernema carpocapsae TaxID=34508 RepID=A0A4U5PLX5_STECR|nr:hypothetical protein L596_010835 [Steinernema carpocapsae]